MKRYLITWIAAKMLHSWSSDNYDETCRFYQALACDSRIPYYSVWDGCKILVEVSWSN